jgi:hypothetical protein
MAEKLTPGETRVLAILRKYPGWRSVDVATWLYPRNPGFNEHVVSRTMTNLEAKGLINADNEPTQKGIDVKL